MGDDVLTATLSTKGQVVIPVELRRQLGLNPGDTIVFDLDSSGHSATIRRRESWDETSQRFRSWIKPGTPPLLDVHGFYDTRPPRL